MQKTKHFSRLSSCSLILVLSLFKSSCQQSFDHAIAKHRNTLVDQVNQPKQNQVPYYTVETLNPVWQLTEETPIISIPKFELTDQDGNHRDQGLFHGTVSVVGFMFVSCHGFCPFLVQGMKSIQRECKLPDQNLKFVALTVNPENDTPGKLKSYAEQHKLDIAQHQWTLLTGDKETIYSLAKNTFASQAFKRPNSENNFVHSEHLYVIDREGKLRGILNGTRTDLAKNACDLIQKI